KSARQENFFFQAEDGIRDKLVTGVQTCALPICPAEAARPPQGFAGPGGHLVSAERQAGEPTAAGRAHSGRVAGAIPHLDEGPFRSEERRVGKECRSRWP